MKKPLAIFNVYDAGILERLEELRQRWHPQGEMQTVLTTLLLRSEALELATPALDAAVIGKFPELAHNFAIAGKLADVQNPEKDFPVPLTLGAEPAEWGAGPVSPTMTVYAVDENEAHELAHARGVSESARYESTGAKVEAPGAATLHEFHVYDSPADPSEPEHTSSDATGGASDEP